MTKYDCIKCRVILKQGVTIEESTINIHMVPGRIWNLCPKRRRNRNNLFLLLGDTTGTVRHVYCWLCFLVGVLLRTSVGRKMCDQK